MEVAGAAAATVLGQIVAAVLAVLFNLTCNHDIHPTLRGFRPNGPVIRNIYSVGAPSIILNSIGSVMTFGMNQILFAFSSTAVAVFNVYFKLQSFVFMPVFGLNNGMVPIVSYNYGARKRKRLVDTVKFSALLAVAIMLVGLVVIQLFPADILGLFEASADMLAIGVPALRIISLCFVFAGFSIICSSTFQALDNGLLGMMISIVRQLLILLPAAFFLSLSGSVTAVWWAFPIAELASLALCVIFLRRIYRRVIPPSGVSAPPSPAYRGRPTFPWFRFQQAILRRLDVGAGAHTRPELASGPEVRADVGIGPYRGLLRQASSGQNAP